MKTFEEWMQKNNYSFSGIDEQEAEFFIKEAWEAAWGEAYMKGFKDGQTVVKQQPNYRKVNVGW